MPSIIILDLMLTETLLLLGIGFIQFQISNHVWLKARRRIEIPCFHSM